MKKLVLLMLCILVLIPFSASAETIVIICGWGGMPEEMSFLKNGIQEKVAGEVIVLKPGRYLPLEDAAADTYQQLQTLGADGNIILVGFSWGGLISRQLAEQHPERIKKIVQIASPNGGYRFAPAFLFRIEAGASKNIPLFIIAGTKSVKRWGLRPVNDGTVDISSALAAKAKASRVFPLGHVELLHSEEVVQQIKMWLDQE